MQANFKYELFFELSPDLLCIAGYDGYFKKINPAVADLLGYSMDELYSRPINEFVHPDDKLVTYVAREQLIKKKPLFNFENRYVSKAGEIVWLSWTSHPVDQEKLIFAIAKNITYKKKLEAERNELVANLTRVNKDLKQLNYTTSHDLRAPVNNLLATFTMIDTSRINDQQTIEMIDILQIAGEKLKQTMDNYVDLLREKDKDPAVQEEVDLTKALNSVLESISSLIQTSKVRIHADFSKLGCITFNEAYMKSIFLNLITNAIKYSRPDCLPEIRIHSENDRGVSRLIVADNGLGMDMEKVKGIFGLGQKFHQHTDSKGIGLYLVHSHVTALGGTISVKSKVNEGTKFTMSFKC